MSDVTEVDGDANDNNNNNEKHTRLPELKKWLYPENEGLWCGMLEVVPVTGVACENVKLKDESTNQWEKAHNGSWDRERGSSVIAKNQKVTSSYAA